MDADPQRNVLMEWYARYVGPPENERDIYAGFALFFAGIALGAVGVAVFLASASTGPNAWGLREVAGVCGALGLPALLLGVTVLLPVDDRAVYAGVAGSAVCLAATVWFTRAYPYNWNVEGSDVSGQVVGLYAVGFVPVVAATGAALVGYRVEQVQAGESGTEADDGSAATDDVAEERARRDYESAMEDANVNWGGVEKTETKRLQFDTGDADDVEHSSFDDVEATTTRSSGSSVDDAVAGLRNLQGGQTKTDSGGGTDDQAAALRELREQKRKEAEREPDGLLARVRDRLRR